MPDDTTPHGGEAFHPPPQRARIPQPKPEHEQDLHEHDPRASEQHAGDLTGRPALPDHPVGSPADTEPDPARASGVDGKDADDDGKASVTRQPG